MAVRHWFGRSPADWTFAVGSGNTAVLSGGLDITAWNAASGGAQYTDLLDAGGNPVTKVTSSSGGALPVGTIPQFQGPPGVTAVWIDAGGGVRYLMTATDVGDAIADLESLSSTVDTLEGTVIGLATVATSGDYADLTGAPALTEVATSGEYGDLTGAPPPGLQYVLKAGASWPVRSSTAPDAARPAVWIGAEPAPPAGGDYALDGDAWWPTP